MPNAINRPQPPGISRPPGIPAWGVTRSLRVIELARWTPREQKQDPVVQVAADGWRTWCPVAPGDLPKRRWKRKKLRRVALEVEPELPAPPLADGSGVDRMAWRWKCMNPYCISGTTRWWVSRKRVVRHWTLSKPCTRCPAPCVCQFGCMFRDRHTCIRFRFTVAELVGSAETPESRP